MKIKNYWLVFGAILVFVVLVLCAFSQLKESMLQAKQEMIKNLIPEEWNKKNAKSMESLADAIISDNEELARFFEKGDFDAMARLYVERGGAIISPEYRIYSCQDIAKFWKGVWKEGARLEFKTVNIYLSDRLGKQPGVVIQKEKPPKEVKFDAVAFVINEFSIVTKKAGGSAYDPYDSRAYAHQEECTWRGGR
jgi:hypothetical protein